MKRQTVVSISVAIVLVLVALVFSLWWQKRQPSMPLVAYVAPTLANPFFVQMREGAQMAAAANGIELVFQAPAGGVEDAAAQIDLVETLLARDPIAICIVPADSRGIIPAVLSANSAGIPVINVDNRIEPDAASAAGAVIATYLGSDNRFGGRLAGEFIVDSLGGNGDVAMLEGLIGSDAAIQRAAGFRSAIDSAPGIRLVASETASWSREQGLEKFLTILQAHPYLDAVFAANDEMALGAIQALNESGSTVQRERIIVVGFDATPDGLEAVRAGRMAATVAQQPAEMGRLCVEEAIDLSRGVRPDSLIPVPVATVSVDSIGDQ